MSRAPSATTSTSPAGVTASPLGDAGVAARASSCALASSSTTADSPRNRPHHTPSRTRAMRYGSAPSATSEPGWVAKSVSRRNRSSTSYSASSSRLCGDVAAGTEEVAGARSRHAMHATAIRANRAACKLPAAGLLVVGLLVAGLLVVGLLVVGLLGVA